MPILSTTYTNLRQGFLDYLGLSYRGTTTADGNANAKTFVDTTDLVVYANDTFNSWWAFITSGTYSGQVREVEDFVQSTGTPTTTSAYGGTIVSGVTYELLPYHPTLDIRWAINRALQMGWPGMRRTLLDDNLVTGNALRDGGLEDWTNSTTPAYWVASGTITFARETTTKWYGRYSMKTTSGATDSYAYQSQTEHPWLLDLAGEGVTVKGWCHADTASHARIRISTTDQDGTTTTTNSSYHDGDSRRAILVAQNHEVPSDLATLQIQLRCEVNTGIAYWDQIRLLSTNVSAYILPDIWQALPPTRVEVQRVGYTHGDEDACDDVGDTYPFGEWPWHRIDYDEDLGLWILRFTRLPETGYKLRLRGEEYIAEVSAEADTVPMDLPQTKLLFSLSGYYLYDKLAKTSKGDGKQDFMEKAADCKREYEELKRTHAYQRERPLLDYGNWRF